MLFDDVRSNVMPYRLLDGRRQIKIEVEPSGMGYERLVADALTGGDGYRSLFDAVCDTFREVSVELLLYQQSVYEMICRRHNDSHECLKSADSDASDWSFSFTRANLSTGRNGHSAGKLLEADHSETCHLRADWRYLATFALPERYRQVMPVILEWLLKIGNSDMALQALNASDGFAQMQFDSIEHRKSQMLALAEVTRPIGWTARASFDSLVSEYYLVLRHLEYERFLMRLRNVILGTLNLALASFGDGTGTMMRVQIHGLSTDLEIDAAVRDLEAGRVRLLEVMDRFRF